MDVRTMELLNKCIGYFDGNAMNMAKAYYETVASLPKHGKFDIIGHFDLITKHNERTPFLDVSSDAYKNMVREAIDALKGKIPFFEVNTGAIPRNYRTNPYPAPFIIKLMKENGFGAIVSSDCHKKEFIDSHFNEAITLLKECGYTSRYILTNDGFKEVAL